MAAPPSLSRLLAGFATHLSYEDLPTAVADKAKALLLHGLVTAVAGARVSTAAQHAVQFIAREEGLAQGGSAILTTAIRATRAGAAYATSELMHATGQSDAYHLFTHPGLTVLPAALAMAESVGSRGDELLTAIVAGYEVQERLAGEFLPSTHARGFRASPVYGVFGAAVAAAKLLRLDEDALHSALALCASLASGTLEGMRSGGQDLNIHEPSAARNGVFAALLAREGTRGGETTLEGQAGFYHAYAGSRSGQLTYAFDGRERADIWAATAELGTHWEILATMHKQYPTGGFNQPVVLLASRLAAGGGPDAAEVERLDVEVNWLEPLYPSPAFPSTPPPTGRGSIPFACAAGYLLGTYPSVAHLDAASAWAIYDLARRVHVVPSPGRPITTPRITVSRVDGSTVSAEATGREFQWDLGEEVRRIQSGALDLSVSPSQCDNLILAVHALDATDDGVAVLFRHALVDTAMHAAR